MKKIILLLVLLIAVIPMVSAATVTRSFSEDSVAPGGTVDVTLTVDILEGQETGVILSDTIPNGWTVANKQSFVNRVAQPLLLTKALAEATGNLVDGSYSYTVIAPANGVGSYSFNGASESLVSGRIPIVGASSITVSAGVPRPEITLGSQCDADADCAAGERCDLGKTNTCIDASVPPAGAGVNGVDQVTADIGVVLRGEGTRVAKIVAIAALLRDYFAQNP